MKTSIDIGDDRLILTYQGKGYTITNDKELVDNLRRLDISEVIAITFDSHNFIHSLVAKTLDQSLLKYVVRVEMEPYMGKCPACGHIGILEDGCPTCPGFWFTTNPVDIQAR